MSKLVIQVNFNRTHGFEPRIKSTIPSSIILNTGTQQQINRSTFATNFSSLVFRALERWRANTRQHPVYTWIGHAGML